MAVMEWLLNLGLVGLLGATLFHAMRLQRALGSLRRDRAALDGLVAGFQDSTRQAQSGIDRLRGTADGAARQMARQIDVGTALRDDLNLLIERGDRVADRLDQLIRAARPILADAPRIPADDDVGSHQGIAAPVTDLAAAASVPQPTAAAVSHDVPESVGAEDHADQPVLRRHETDGVATEDGATGESGVVADDADRLTAPDDAVGEQDPIAANVDAPDTEQTRLAVAPSQPDASTGAEFVADSGADNERRMAAPVWPGRRDHAAMLVREAGSRARGPAGAPDEPTVAPMGSHVRSKAERDLLRALRLAE